MTSPGGGDFPCCAPAAPDQHEWDDRECEREHDCCPRCGSGSCLGSGSLGWDGCEDPVWIPLDSWTELPCQHGGDDLGRYEADVCHGCGAVVTPAGTTSTDSREVRGSCASGPSPLLHSDPEPAPKCKGEAR